MSHGTGVKTVYSVGPIVQKIQTGVWIWRFILDLSEVGPQDPVERFVNYTDRRVLFIFHDYVHDRDWSEKILDAQTRSTQWMQSRLQYHELSHHSAACGVLSEGFTVRRRVRL